MDGRELRILSSEGRRLRLGQTDGLEDAWKGVGVKGGDAGGGRRVSSLGLHVLMANRHADPSRAHTSHWAVTLLSFSLPFSLLQRPLL